MARRPILLSWAPHFLEVHSGPIRGKSDSNLRCHCCCFSLGPHQGLSLLKARFLLWLTALLFLAPGKSVAQGRGGIWRRLTLWGAPALRGLPLTSLGPALMHRPSVHKIFLLLGSCHSSISLRDQQLLLLFFISRIYPGIRLLFYCNPYTTQGSFHSPHRPKGSEGVQNFDRHLYLSSGDKRPITSISFFLTPNKDQFKYSS